MQYRNSSWFDGQIMVFFDILKQNVKVGDRFVLLGI